MSERQSPDHPGDQQPRPRPEEVVLTLPEDPPQPAMEACDACGYDLERVKAGVRNCPGCGQKIGARLCKKCGYDLRGITWSPASCPECGEWFDPRDKGTFMTQPRSESFRRDAKRFGLPLLFIALLIVGTETGLAPRPHTLYDWRLWQWRGELYGVEHVTGGRSARSPNRAAFVYDGTVHWWGSSEYPRKVRGIDPVGDERFRVEQFEDGTWELEVTDTETTWAQAMGAFGAMKDRMFGVQYDNRDRDFAIGERLTLRGDEIDIFGALLLGSGTSTTPFVVNSNQRYVWLVDHMQERFMAMSIEDAEEAGIEVQRPRRLRNADVGLIEPRPSDIVSVSDAPLSSGSDEQHSGS